MKFSSATIASILAATAAAQSAEGVSTPLTSEMVARQIDVDAVISSLQGLHDALHLDQKRQLNDFVETYIGKRDIDWAGLLNKVFSALPGIISSIWNSGIIQNIFNWLWNSEWFKKFLSNAFTWVINLITKLFSGSGSSAPAPTGTAKPAPTGTGKRSETGLDMHVKRQVEDHVKRMENLLERLNNDESLTARDFASTLGDIFSAIWNSGVIQNVYNWVVNWIKTNPDQFQSYLNSALSFVGSLVGQLWTWLQSSGILDSAFKWLGANIGNILQTVIKFIGALFSGPSTPTSAAPPAATTLAHKRRTMY
ncbi:hypothetical protein DICA4_D00364 [Diutina catenulata]